MSSYEKDLRCLPGLPCNLNIVTTYDQNVTIYKPSNLSDPLKLCCFDVISLSIMTNYNGQISSPLRLQLIITYTIRALL
jgi:hypothetical protein